MEKRVVLLVVLCVLVFVGWAYLMRAIQGPPPKPQDPGPAAPAPPDSSTPKKDPAPAPQDVPAVQDDESEVLSELRNKNVLLKFTNKGAGIREAFVYVEGQKEMHLLQRFDRLEPHMAVAVEGSKDDTARTGWTVLAPEANDPVKDRSLTYQFKLRNGVDILKKFTLQPDRGEVEMTLTMRPHAKEGLPKPETLRLRLLALTGLAHDSSYRYDYYGHGFVTTEITGAHATQQVSYDAPTPRPRWEGDLNPPRVHSFEVPAAEKATRNIEWTGLRNRYAAAILVSKEDLKWVRRVDFHATMQPGDAHNPPLKGLAVEAVLRDASIEKASSVAEFSLFLAPIRAKELAPIKGAEDYLLSYGCWGLFNPIGRLILLLVRGMHSLVGNFGWAIILTTLVIRLLMFPLTRKSQVSMARMAELQPKLNLLRERYADDAAKNQQETMKLFKEHGVNPLSGCFPILLQLPVFIGLYSVLDISLEFRQQPFIGWIDNLSQPDRWHVFKTPIPLLFTTLAEFNVLPIVMTITWFLQSYYAPKPQDPKMAAQQRMMMFMPVVFGLLCYSLASGLSLYLFVNSLLAMIEQKVIKKYLLPAKAPTGPPGKP